MLWVVVVQVAVVEVVVEVDCVGTEVVLGDGVVVAVVEVLDEDFVEVTGLGLVVDVDGVPPVGVGY